MAAALLAAILFIPGRVEAISAESAIVVDATTGRVLFEKNADRRSLIASTTKMMTALVVCEQCNVLDRMRIPKEAVGIEGSSLYLQEGEILTVQDLLYGMMLQSGNDAAVALAIYCGGTVEGFVELMNDKARCLNLENTHFENPSGLDAPGHYSTARDLAKLAAYAMENPIFYQTVSTKTVTFGNRTVQNHNKLLWQLDGADGVKTGYTRAAGRTLVSSATRNGRRLIAVTLRDADDWSDHRQMLTDGFSGFQLCQIIRTGETVGSVPVVGGTEETVQVTAAESFDYALAPGEKTEIVFSGPGFVYAPVTENASAGIAYICLNGKVIGKIPIQYQETVEQQQLSENKFWHKWFGERK